MTGSFLWSLLVLFFMIIYFMMLFTVIADLFRQKEMGGGLKVLWLLFLLIIPVFSLLIYVICYGKGMAERNHKAQDQLEKQQADYIRKVAGDAPGGSAADQIAQGQKLLESGAITQAEFDALKKKALS